MDTPTYFALGLRRRREDRTLDVRYADFHDQEELGLWQAWSEELCWPSADQPFITLASADLPKLKKHPLSEREQHVIELFKYVENDYHTSDLIVMALFDIDQPVKNAEEAYAKLHLLSQRKLKPHQTNLENAFGSLTNVAWTNAGPYLPQDTPLARIAMAQKGLELMITHVDKFPYMLSYETPSNVRVAASSQVRLGAYLGSGTTVMPAGYINFNAGTQGPSMVEGRISAGVFVDKDSDVGGAASIMGTLSGGNDNVISIGASCLLGAMSGTGISLGYGCTIAAGTYVTAGSKVSMYDQHNTPINLDGAPVQEGQNITKALHLSGRSNLLFYTDTTTGKMVCKPNQQKIELNDQLHQNQ
jgi:2,3,4,5-tetrahydropyridine-2-carboxylate N-succinyltransferase